MLEFNSKNPTNINQSQIRKNHNCTKPLYLNINKSSFVFIIYNPMSPRNGHLTSVSLTSGFFTQKSNVTITEL